MFVKSRTPDTWVEEYRTKHALWIHDGNPKRPHALLTSDKHSSGFFDSRPVIEDEDLLADAAVELVEMLNHHRGYRPSIDVVVGPQTGGTRLAQFIKEQVDLDHPSSAYSISLAKRGKGKGKSFVFTDEERSLLPGQMVLLCDDVITTGASIDQAAQEVIREGGWLAPFVLALVNRSGLNEVNGREILALVNHPMRVWDPEAGETCLLCKQGSKAVRPKSKEGWDLLNAQY